MQNEFYELLTERNQEGATVFLSSHVLSEISRYCKHAAVIRDGKILASDSVEKLGHTGVKRVTLQSAERVPEIPDAKYITVENGSVSFLYSGSPKQLLTSLADLSFEDFTVTDPDLEEVFMHYYVKEQN